MRLGKKISLVTTALVVTLGVLTILFINYVVAGALRDSVQDKEISLAKVVANNIANPVLSGNYLTVQRTLEVLKEEHGVVYAFLILPNGNVMQTLSGGISPQLVELNRVKVGQTYTLRSFLSDQGRVQDVGVFLLDGLDSELHIGFSEDYIQASLRRVFVTILGVTLVGIILAGMAAAGLGKYLSAPIEKLTQMTRKIAAGQFEHRVEIEAQDEVGELAQGFNLMVTNLQENIAKLQAAEEDQRVRNRELSALNLVAETVRLIRDTDEVLREFLTKLLATMGLSGGWICLPALGVDDTKKVIAAGINPTCVSGEESRCRSCNPADIERGKCIVQDFLVLDGQSYWVTELPVYVSERILGTMSILSEEALIPSDVVTLQSIGGQLGTLIENVTLWETLKAREEKVRQLLEKSIAAQEDERKRIARELHDETSQSLAALAMLLKVSGGWLRRDPVRAEQLIEESKDEVVRILRELHNIVYHLRPTLLDDLGLIPALRWCAESRDWKAPVEIMVHGSQSSQRIETQVETTLFRIGQEAISNSAKYSYASRLDIEFSVTPTYALLRISDNGRGFSFNEQISGKQPGKQPLGLLGMVERASLIGGHVQISSEVGADTTVEAVIPLKPGEDIHGEDQSFINR